MPVLSTTSNAFAALLCAACAAGCAQSANTPGSDFGSTSQGDDSGVVPEAAANTGASAADASGATQMMAASGSGGGSSSSGGTASSSGGGSSSSGSSSGSSSSSSSGSGMSTPDSGAAITTNFGDGGPCTPNLGCVLNPPASTGDITVDCVNRINQFRTTCACLPALARWTDGEACANMDAQYDGMKMSGHAGAMANICPWGQAQDECPGYPSNQSVIGTCLQQMWSEGPPPAGTTIAQCESPAMYASCYEMHGHFINMSNPMVTKVACGFATASGGAIWAAQNFE